MRRICSVMLVLLMLVTFAGCFGLPQEQATQTSSGLEGDGLIILCYHRILPGWLLNWGRLVEWDGSEFSSYCISTEDFTSHLEFLQDEGVRFLTPQEAEDFLAGEKFFPGKLVLVTFDDGDVSLYKHAFPVLEEKQIPFLLFFIAGQANEEWEGFTMCSWDQIHQMMGTGLCTVGLHTYDLHYHDAETGKPVFVLPENAEIFEQDTKKGVNCLKKHLGIDVKYFAYPYGFGTSKTDQIVISNGIPNIFTLRGKVNKSSTQRSFIGRVMVTPELWPMVENWARSR